MGIQYSSIVPAITRLIFLRVYLSVWFIFLISRLDNFWCLCARCRVNRKYDHSDADGSAGSSVLYIMGNLDIGSGGLTGTKMWGLMPMMVMMMVMKTGKVIWQSVMDYYWELFFNIEGYFWVCFWTLFKFLWRVVYFSINQRFLYPKYIK